MDGQFEHDEDMHDPEAVDGLGGERETVEDDSDREQDDDMSFSHIGVPENIIPDLDSQLLREVHEAEKGDYFYVKKEEDYLALKAYFEGFNPLGLSVEHKPGLGHRIMRYGR